MSSARYIARRALEYLAMWLAATALDFAVPRLAPLTPVREPGGELARAMGLGKPVYEQYFIFLWNAVHLDLGTSLWLYGTPVAYLVARALQYDVVLLAPAILISWILGNRLGAYLAIEKRGTALDKAVVPVLYAMSSAPYFWWALLLVEIFSAELRLLPPTGVIYSKLPSLTPSYVADFLRHLATPLAALVLAMTGAWALSMREIAISELRSGYVAYEEALGFSGRIIRGHIRRNSRPPQLANLAVSLGLIASGNMVLEAVVGYPGVGVLLYNALSNYDYVLIQGIFFVVVSLILALNFAVDVATALTDPRAGRPA
ncbi:MAG: ABC transporter permease [Thermoproteus sp.]